MHPKLSLERGSCEGFSKQGIDKRLRVDQHRVRYLNLESETEIEPSLSSGLSAPAPATSKLTKKSVSHDKKVVDRTKKRNKREVVTRPPKTVTNATLVRTGLNGVSKTKYFSNQKRNDSSNNLYKDSQPPKNLDNAERKLLPEIIRTDNEVGVDENKLENMASFGVSYSLKATQSDNSVTPSASEKSLEDKEENNIVCSSPRNRVQSTLRFHLAGGNYCAGGTSYDYQVDLCCNMVRKVLDLFRDTLKKLQLEHKKKASGQVKSGINIHIDAAMQLKKQHPWVNLNKFLGAVPGVEIGDHFQSRAELVIIGLHRKFIAGIDYMNINGKLLATSIVASDRYGDKNESSDILTYMGEGGNHVFSSNKPENQKLVRGNLALMNSKDEQAAVRVIRSCQNSIKKSQLIYDGLYTVSNCREEVESCGRLVYKFQLNRMQGQQKLIRWDTTNGLRRSNKASLGPIVVCDISEGKENTPVRVVNAVDFEKPPPFKYITRMMYHPQLHAISKPSLCECLDGCSEDIPCSCIIKNNSCEVCVNDGVSIAEKKPMAYECGPSCKCPPDCKNRMTQHGIKLQLEIFKTITKQWGVRSRNFISEGRFICEYVGELLQYNQEEGIIDFDKSAFDVGNSYGTEGSQLYPNLQSSSSSKDKDIKNVKFGNVGRFIRHSCSPNLYAKCVLFDYEDNTRPHVMLFAGKNITPRRELTFDYKLW